MEPLVVRLSDSVTIINADCRDVLPIQCDAVVTDPPYGLGFMGKAWDHAVPGVEFWRKCFDSLKPGGHLLAFAGTRTQHRMASAIEDAGFEIRDMIAWVYSQGFPKSLDVSKAIDKAAGAEREIVGPKMRPDGKAMIDARPNNFDGSHEGWDRPWKNDREAVVRQASITAPATDAARQWAGFGTALKPSLEPITVARKPLDGCTVAENVLRHGTGAINVDGCRVGTDDRLLCHAGQGKNANTYAGGWENYNGEGRKYAPQGTGRWPANLIHDGSDEVVGLFPDTKSGGGNGNRRGHGPLYGDNTYGNYKPKKTTDGIPPDTGSAARFFYCAKASKRDRDEGCEGQNKHCCVKPTDLMRYLCRLVTPPGGIVLDPFMGSGSTGKAALREGFRFIGIEKDADSFAIARARLENELRQGMLPLTHNKY